MVFKWNRMQRDIDSFKMMQEGLSPAARTMREAQRAAAANHSTADERMSETRDETSASLLNDLTSDEGDFQHTLVSGEAIWEGKLRTDASARIEGTISGEIDAGETVFIAKGAHVRANVHARRVIVAGTVEGEITCREQLVVEQSGRIEGKVSTETIIIEEGAIVQSEIQMLRGKAPVKTIAPVQTIGKDATPRDDSIPVLLSKMNSKRLKHGQSESLELKPINPQFENGGE